MIGEPVTTSARTPDVGNQNESPARSEGVEKGRPPRLPWSEEDIASLKALCAENLASADIAARLGRTQRAVDAMSLRLGIRRHDAIRPWAEDECRLILTLHSQGANWATIAGAVPGRSAIAIFRKLSQLLGPAPFKSRPEPAPLVAPPVIVPVCLPPSRVRPSPPPAPLAALRVGVDAVVRWLRSRDFMVVRQENGWRVDHRRLGSTEALLDFTNIRRSWLRLPPFVLVEILEDDLAEIADVAPPKKMHRFGSMGFR